LVICGAQLVSGGFELVNFGVKLVSCRAEFVSCEAHFPLTKPQLPSQDIARFPQHTTVFHSAHKSSTYPVHTFPPFVSTVNTNTILSKKVSLSQIISFLRCFLWKLFISSSNPPTPVAPPPPGPSHIPPPVHTQDIL
jgi:hypothetical protein